MAPVLKPALSRDVHPPGPRRRHLSATLVQVAPVWAAWLAVVVVLAVVAVLTGLAAEGHHAGQPYVVREGVLWPFHAWDVGRYRAIAATGYPDGRGGFAYAFFPLWPGLLSLGRPDLVGALVAVPASLAAFVGVSHLSPAQPRRTAITLALWPGSFTLAMLYPDGLALALAVAALACAWRRRYLSAGLLAAIAATARPNAWLLVIPLAAVALESRRVSAWVAAAAPVLATAAVEIAFALRSGSLTATASAQRQWGRTGPWHLGVEVWGSARHGHVQSVVEVAIAVAVIALCVRAWRSFPDRALPLYASAVVALSLGTGSFQSIGRQSLAAFPLVWLVAFERPGILGRPAAPWVAGALNAGLWLAIAVFAP